MLFIVPPRLTIGRRGGSFGGGADVWPEGRATQPTALRVGSAIAD